MMLGRKNKISKLSKNFLRGLVNQNLGNWNIFMLKIVEIHTLSNDLRRNL
jgi:hypothetical protein